MARSGRFDVVQPVFAGMDSRGREAGSAASLRPAALRSDSCGPGMMEAGRGALKLPWVVIPAVKGDGAACWSLTGINEVDARCRGNMIGVLTGISSVMG